MPITITGKTDLGKINILQSKIYLDYEKKIKIESTSPLLLFPRPSTSLPAPLFSTIPRWHKQDWEWGLKSVQLFFTAPSGNTQMLQCGVFHRLQCISSSRCSGHMLHHGPLHVLHGNTYSGAWSISLSLILSFPVLFFTPSACPTFLHFFKHAFTAAPRAQLLHSTPDWCGSVAELAEPEPRTGKPQQFLTDATALPNY